MKLLLMVLASPLIAFAKPELKKIELQWAVCEPSAEVLMRKMGAADFSGQPYSMSYFDTQNLRLLANGVSARVGAKNKDGNRTVSSKVKVEFANEDMIDWDWISGKNSKCEYDRYGYDTRIRCTIQREIDAESPWSHKQEDFVRHFRPGMTLSGLSKWGPYQGRELSFEFGDYEVNVDELTIGQNTDPLLEASIRTKVDDADHDYDHFTQTLIARGVHLCGTQKGKFERLLERLK